MADDENGLREDYTYDCVHPNKTGYRVIYDLANKEISTIFGLNGINDWSGTYKISSANFLYYCSIIIHYVSTCS